MNKNLTTLDQLINKKIGPKGSLQRKKFDSGYETFKKRILKKILIEKKSGPK